jgi:arsenite transporter
MMYPILCKVQYETLHDVFSHKGAWKQIGFSVLMNWVVAPFFMVGMSGHITVACS